MLVIMEKQEEEVRKKTNTGEQGQRIQGMGHTVQAGKT